MIVKKNEKDMMEVFTGYGLAMTSALIVEKTLAFMCILKRINKEPEKIQEIKAKVIKMTMGPLKDEVIDEYKLSGLQKELDDANRTRIHLIHYWADNIDKMDTEEERKGIKKELLQIAEKYKVLRDRLLDIAKKDPALGAARKQMGMEEG